MFAEPKEGTQHFAILDYLRTGKSLTGLDALRICGTMKLSSRVGELKEMGHNILSETIETTNGKHVKKYWLSEEEPRIEQEEIISHNHLAQEQVINYKEVNRQLVLAI